MASFDKSTVVPGVLKYTYIKKADRQTPIISATKPVIKAINLLVLAEGGFAGPPAGGGDDVSFYDNRSDSLVLSFFSLIIIIIEMNKKNATGSIAIMVSGVVG